MKIGSKTFDLTSDQVYVMGILNVTPDSFSDGGRFNDRDKALRHVEEMISDGADIIDIGGESTRPGYVKISEEEEITRVCDMISSIKERFDIPISVDTYKPVVMDASLGTGADLANDIWGCRYDSKMAEVMAKHQVPVVLMHNDNMGRDMEDRKKLGLPDSEISEENVIRRVCSGLRESVEIAKSAGVKEEIIILDPGIGFAKTQRENLLVMQNLREVVNIGYPVLLGTSRKSMIGNALDLPVGEREEGTMVTTVLGAEAGCKFVRVHDVKANVRALKMLRAIEEA